MKLARRLCTVVPHVLFNGTLEHAIIAIAVHVHVFIHGVLHCVGAASGHEMTIEGSHVVATDESVVDVDNLPV